MFTLNRRFALLNMPGHQQAPASTRHHQIMHIRHLTKHQVSLHGIDMKWEEDTTGQWTPPGSGHPYPMGSTSHWASLPGTKHHTPLLSTDHQALTELHSYWIGTILVVLHSSVPDLNMIQGTFAYSSEIGCVSQFHFPYSSMQ